MARLELTCWLAGFADGEGHIRVKPGGGISFEITNSNHHVIDYIARVFNGTVRNARDSRKGRKGRNIRRVSWYGPNALTVLRSLLPHLHVKQAEANAVCAWASTAPSERMPASQFADLLKLMRRNK